MIKKLSFDKSLRIEGTNLDELLFNEEYELRLDSEVAQQLSGNDSEITATFSLTPKAFRYKRFAYVSLYHNDEHVQTLTPAIRIYNPLFKKYKRRHTQRFLRNTRNRKASKRTVGLNVHWSLGGIGSDDLYRQKLQHSHTRWVREFVYFETLIGENRQNWLERYDAIFDEYRQQHMRVVVMLAYGDTRNGADRYVPPTQDQWQSFVRTVVKRYRNSVDAWEIWNEPDSPSYMHPNTPKALHPLLKTGYPIIKHYDPGSIVLNGPIGDITNTDFVKKMYKRSGKYFDELSIHLYYCDEYVHNGNNGKLFEDLERLQEAIPPQRRKQKIWVTELGCSLGTQGVNTQIQKQYMKSATTKLLATGKFRTILLYDFRDRPFLNNYEAQFGLMSEDGTNKPIWKWYRKLPKQ